MGLEIYTNTIDRMDLKSLQEEYQTLESIRNRLPYGEESKIEMQINIVGKKIAKLLSEQKNTVLH